MTPEEIGRLVEMARRAGVYEVDLNGPGASLRLRLEPTEPSDQLAPKASPDIAVARSLAHTQGARSPGVGLFRHRHPLTGRASSQAGQHVARGQIVGFLDAGSCLRAVTAPYAGTIGAPVSEEGALVGYATLLYPIA